MNNPRRELSTLAWICVLTLLFGACAAILTHTLANAQVAAPVSMSAVLEWNPPTVNEDGTALTDLAKYRFAVAPATVDLQQPGVIPLQEWTTPDASCPGVPCEAPAADLFDGLPTGEYRVWVKAVDLAGNESEYSPPSNAFSFDGIAPVSPTNLKVIVNVHVDVRVGG